jgi:hypothetical protein
MQQGKQVGRQPGRSVLMEAVDRSCYAYCMLECAFQHIMHKAYHTHHTSPLV